MLLWNLSEIIGKSLNTILTGLALRMGCTPCDWRLQPHSDVGVRMFAPSLTCFLPTKASNVGNEYGGLRLE